MTAIRQIHKVTSGAFTVTLPSDFYAKEVEIIILPIGDENGKSQHLQKLLLAAPTLTEDELHKFEEVREWMHQKNISEFCLAFQF